MVGLVGVAVARAQEVAAVSVWAPVEELAVTVVEACLPMIPAVMKAKAEFQPSNLNASR